MKQDDMTEEHQKERIARYIQKFVHDELGIDVSVLMIRKWMVNGATAKPDVYKFSGDIHQEVQDALNPDQK